VARRKAKHRRLTEEVRTDPLTRLPNLRRQQEDLSAAVDAHAQRGVPFSVAFVDIDAFGLFNKTMGQQKGDAVLRDVGEVLQNTCRESDTVYRRGGEEFIVIFRNTAAKAAHKIAVRMKDKVKRSIDGVTVSIGLVTFDPDLHGDGEGAIAAADQLMRLAKREGGDRVFIAA
jgi:diguanylate cyclase (GGDEF)-like protein